MDVDGSSLFTDQGGVIISALELSLAEHDNAAHITLHVIIFTSDLSNTPQPPRPDKHTNFSNSYQSFLS